jgi:hypothetical protein
MYTVYEAFYASSRRAGFSKSWSKSSCEEMVIADAWLA